MISFAGAFLTAVSVPLSGTWYLIESGTGNTTSLVTGDADTIEVSQANDTNKDRGAVTYLDSTVSLTDVGDYIQFTGDYSGDVGNNVSWAIRIGFYDSNGNTVSSDFSSASDNWIGLFAASANRSTSGARSNNLYQPLNADMVLDLGDTSPNSEIGGNVTNISTGNRTITFRIEKTSATDLSLQLISGSVNHTDSLAIATAPSTSFDALSVSFKFGSSTKTLSAQFDNIEVTTVPEPASFAAVLGLFGLLVMLRRRRR